MTFEEFAAYLRAVSVRVEPNLAMAVEVTTHAAAETARGYIGHYQGAAGGYPAWAPLAPSTLREKERLGYAPPDNPLLRTGDMRDSIVSEAESLVGRFGSDSKIALYQEMGTSRGIPPRSFIGRAAHENISTFEEQILAAAERIFAVA